MIEFLQEKNYQLVDVRSFDEFQEFNVEGSLNIPLTDFFGRVNEIDINRPVIIYCSTGARSRVAWFYLKFKGYKVANIRRVDEAKTYFNL